MADNITIELKDSAEAYAKAVDATLDPAPAKSVAAVKAVAKSAKPVAAKAKKAVKAAPAKAKKIAKKATSKASAKVAPKIKKAVRKAASPINERTKTMFNTDKNLFNFDAIPAMKPFQTMFADVNGRGQDMVKKSQKVAEEMADLTRANVEAAIEAGRVAVEGAKTLGQDVIANGRDGVEKAADHVRTLAETKSPTEFMQSQAEFARAQFDRMVTDSSKMTEAFVKLAGEAFQPIQNRASKNAEKFNTLVA